MIVKGNEILERIGIENFRPHFLFQGPHGQTIASTYWPGKSDFSVDAKLHRLDLSDGDVLMPVVDTPPPWKGGDRIFLMVHGLTGCYRSTYLIRIGELIYNLGFKVIRLNLRNAGPSVGLSKRIYHCGVSQDLREVIQWITAQYPQSPITVIGFSLGGNVTLKMLGEDQQNITGNVDSAIAVSPPVNLSAGAKKLRKRENLIYNWFFTRRLKKDILEIHSSHPDLSPIFLPRNIDLVDFDNIYTAPQNGFKDAEDYYTKVASLPLLKAIRCRTLILGSMDDPVVELSDLMDIESDFLEILLTQKGGHVAFIDQKFGLSWMDQIILRWINKL